MKSKSQLRISCNKVIFIFLLLITSCQIISPKIRNITRTNDTEYESDSLQYTTILNNLITFVNKNLNKNEFIVNDSSDHLETQIRYGSFFDESTKHLITTITINDYIYFTIFILKDNTFQKLLSEDIWKYNFIGFYIQDINGDMQNDFIKITMASSGCCPREQHSVYVYQTSTGNFYKSIPFMNPVFLPDKKQIVGFEYGQPIDTYLYKIGWNDFNTDTLEYIKHNISDSTNQTFLRIFNPVSVNCDTIIIDSIPDEYKNISNWFLSTEY